MPPVKKNNTLGKVTLSYGFGMQAGQQIFNLLSHNQFSVERIDSGRKTPIAKYEGMYFSGTKRIRQHFFPDSKE